MKPQWSDAPEWAKWLAMDANGEWWWFQRQPVTASEWRMERSPDGQLSEATPQPDPNWRDTLEPRPTK